MFKELLRQKKKLHHAYLIEGNKKNNFFKLCNFLEKELLFSVKNNPDFWYANFDTFGIDDGRKINELQSKKSFLGGKQIFIITTDFITREAQNSLLKMFEEPTDNTYFFIIMTSSENLLPTLKSRLMIIKNNIVNTSQNDFVRDFLKSDVSTRIKMIKNFLGDPSKKILANKGEAIIFLNQLEKVLRDKIEIKKITKKQIFIFREIRRCRSYLNDRSPSVKMLLTQIAVIL